MGEVFDMTPLMVDPDVAERLQQMADAQHTTVNDLLRRMIESSAKPLDPDALEAFLGKYDDDIPDISQNIKETVRARFKRDYDDPA